MASKKSDGHLYELAKLGARAQLSDLLQEARLLIGLFPDLRDSFDKDELPMAFILKKGRDRAAARTGRAPRRLATGQHAAAGRVKKH